MKWLIGLVGLLALFGLWRWRMSEAQLIMARTLYGEARGEGREGMEAVANVILNRAALPGWWGDGIISVCLAPYQFSTWNEDDPNRAIIERLAPGDNATFDLALAIAGEALAGDLIDYTNGATHYHTMAVNPRWAANMPITAIIGNHEFYRGA